MSGSFAPSLTLFFWSPWPVEDFVRYALFLVSFLSGNRSCIKRFGFNETVCCLHSADPSPVLPLFFFIGRSPRPVGELNTLIDELLVVVELLVGSGQGAVAEADVKTLIHFVVDCPQPNQVG